jgi:Spy/CpxP family protein refolding chaperone
MSEHIRRFGLAVGAALIALGVAAGVIAATQNTSAQEVPFKGDHTGPPPMGPGAFGRMGPMGPMGLVGPIVERLGLSDAQKDSVKTIMQSHAAEFKALAERAGTARRGLEDAVMADPIDDAAIRQKSADVAAVDADMAVAAAHVRTEVFQVLTADQRDQAKQWAARRAERGGRKGR